MNIAKLNTASLDDKTFIIKRGTSGGGTPDTPSGGGDGWEYYDVRTMEDKLMFFEFFGFAPYVLCGCKDGTIYHGVQDTMLNISYLGENPDNFWGIGYCMENRITVVSNGTKTEMTSGEYMKDLAEMMGFDPFAAAIRITKEQFYSLE